MRNEIHLLYSALIGRKMCWLDEVDQIQDFFNKNGIKVDLSEVKRLEYHRPNVFMWEI